MRRPSRRHMQAPLTTLARLGLSAIFLLGGTLHLLKPGIYRPIMPAWLPAHDALILISGVAEIAGGIGMLVPRTRRAAGLGLILLLIAVCPANVTMLQRARTNGVPAWAEALLWLRLPGQGLLIWWAWRLAARPRPAHQDHVRSRRSIG